MWPFSAIKKTQQISKQKAADNLLRQAFKYHELNAQQFIEARERGANLDIILDNGLTPLSKAVTQKDFKLLKMLLRLGANPEMIDLFGQKPADYANDYSYIFEKEKQKVIALLTTKKENL